MVDENNKPLPDDEYQFPQDEYTSPGEAKPEAEVEAPAAGNVSRVEQILQHIRNVPFLKNKRVLVVLASVILLFVILHFLNEKKVVPVAPVQPVVQAAPAQSNDTDMLGSLSSLKAHSSRTESQIENLQSELSAMQNNLTQAQAANLALQKSVTDLTVQMQGLSAQLSAALSKKMPAKNKLRVFHLRAVLPDRAWITSGSGETISVTVGDHVKDYGSIESIDAKMGVVMTSSGRKIEYGPNDY